MTRDFVIPSGSYRVIAFLTLTLAAMCDGRRLLSSQRGPESADEADVVSVDFCSAPTLDHHRRRPTVGTTMTCRLPRGFTLWCPGEDVLGVRSLVVEVDDYDDDEPESPGAPASDNGSPVQLTLDLSCVAFRFPNLTRLTVGRGISCDNVDGFVRRGRVPDCHDGSGVGGQVSDGRIDDRSPGSAAVIILCGCDDDNDDDDFPPVSSSSSSLKFLVDSVADAVRLAPAGDGDDVSYGHVGADVESVGTEPIPEPAVVERERVVLVKASGSEGKYAVDYDVRVGFVEVPVRDGGDIYSDQLAVASGAPGRRLLGPVDLVFPFVLVLANLVLRLRHLQ